MRTRTFARIFAFAIAFVVARSADAHLQGVWNGSVTVNEACDGAASNWSSPARLEIAETGDDFVANLLIESVAGCGGGSFTAVLPMVGTSSDLTQFTATMLVPSGEGMREAAVAGTVAGPSMNFSAGSIGLSGSFTQAGSEQPSTQFSGGYSGSVVVTRVCANGSFSAESLLQGSVTHTGQLVAGVLSFDEPRHFDVNEGNQCVYHEVRKSGVAMLMARIEGGALTGTLLPMTSGQSSEEDDGEGPVPFTGTISSGRIAGTFSADGDTGTLTLTGSTTAPPPVITEFVADPPSVATPGQAVTLRWTTVNAQSVSIDHGVGQQPASGSVIVRPLATTRYTLTATGNGSATMQVTVAVAGAEARVVVARPPDGFVQPANEGGGRDTFVLANVGQAETTVTLSNGGDPFFTFTPSTITLAGRSAAPVTVTGLARPAGVYIGELTLSGQGVPAGAAVRIRMLSAVPPNGSVDPRPLRARTEVRTVPGQGGAGTIAFRNHGTAMLHAMAVSDVGFIVPQTGVILLAPGEVGSVNFTIDPSRRPAERPVGALTGRLSLVFLRGGTNNASHIFGAATPTSSVSVSLVHVVNPGLAPGTPPALAPGELATFASGLGNTSFESGDLFLSSATSSILSDLSLYLSGGSGSQRATLPPLPSDAAFSFPTVLSSAFGSSVSTGAAQVRTGGQVSLAAMRTNSGAPEGTYSTALPVFRSDRGIAPAAQAILSGVQKSGSIETDVVVQELTGSSASFRLDFLAANGSVISSGSQHALAPFAFTKIEDAVPPETAAVRVTNTSSAAAQIGAYGLVTHPVGDAWPIIDPSLETAAADTMFVPLVSAGEGAETLLFVTNAAASTATVTADVRGAKPSRRRVVRQSSTSASRLPRSSHQVVTQSLAPLQTVTIDIGAVSSGYVQLSSSAAPLAASARSVREDSAGRAFGTSLPVAPAAAAIAVGSVKRFAGVEDASQRSRENAVPATYRTHLLLIETTGQSAKVRVNLHYLFATSLASTKTVSSKEFTIGGAQALRLGDVAREIIGPERDSFGDLRDMTLEIEVIEGPGRVLPFVHSIDNGSGDSAVRSD